VDVNSPDEGARIERTYGGYAESQRKRRAWSAANRGNAAIRQELLGHLLRVAGPRLEDAKVLDVGCGTGWWLRALREQGVAAERLHGLDILPSRARAAAAAAPGARVGVGDARRLPYPALGFDLVLLFTVLSSLKTRGDARAALAEAMRVLTPDGVLLCYEPRVPNPLNSSSRLISRKELERALGSAWDEIHLTVLPPLSRRLGRLTDRLYPRLARRGLLLTHRLAVYRKAT
jgi:ubiquinone/menaquinone biosynthesis C-methylase UbiE